MAENKQRLIIGLGGTGANVRDTIQRALADRLKAPEAAESVCFIIDDPDTKNPEEHTEPKDYNPGNP